MNIIKFLIIATISAIITFFVKRLGLIQYDNPYFLTFVILPIILHFFHYKRFLPINLVPIFNGLPIIGIPLLLICLFESVIESNFGYSFIYILGLFGQIFGLAKLNKTKNL